MSTVVNVQEARTRLSDLLKRVEAGESFVIARNGTPIAELTPVQRPEFVFGGFPEVVVTDEFFEPMTEAELTDWEDSPLVPRP